MKWLALALPLLLASCGKQPPPPPPSPAAAAPTVDPVCRMTVDPAKAIRHVHEGRDYYFCAETCVEQFKADPAKHKPPCACGKVSKKCPCEHCGKHGDPCDCRK